MPKRKVTHLRVVSDAKERPRNKYSDAFEVAFERHYDNEPYQRRSFDFVHLGKLLKLHGGVIDIERWERAIANYFATPQGQHTLADLCSRYATFVKWPLDRFRRPVAVRSTVEDSLKQFE